VLYLQFAYRLRTQIPPAAQGLRVYFMLPVQIIYSNYRMCSGTSSNILDR